MYKLLSAVAVLVVLAVGGLFVAPMVIDWNAHRDSLEEALREATGLDIDIGGDLDITFLPSPRVNAADVTWTTGGDQPSSVRIPGVRARMALGDLIGGDLRITDVTLSRPQAVLVIDDAVGPVAAGDRPGGGAPFQLNRVEIEAGSLTLQRQAAPDASAVVEDLNAVLTVSQTGRRVNLKGSGQSAGQTFDYTASVGGLLTDRPISLNGNVVMPDVAAKVSFDGTLEPSATDLAATGRLAIEADNLAALARHYMLPFAVGEDESAKLEGEGRFSNDSLVLENIAFSTGGARATGSFGMAFGERPRVDAAVAFSRVDVNRISGTEALDPGAAVTAFLEWLTQADGSVLPVDLDLGLLATADAMQVGSSIVHDARVSMELEDGILFLKNADALLPGGSDVALSGVFEPADTGLSFEGSLGMTSDNLRSLLDWAGVDARRVPPSRLRSLELSGTLRSGPETLSLDDVRANLDASRATGRVVLGTGTEPRFDIALAFDTFSVDAYRLRPSDGSDRRPLNGDGPDALGFLTSADGTLALDFDRLILMGQPLEKAALRGTLSDGVMDVQQLEVADFAGVSLDGSLLMSLRAGQPQIGFDVTTRTRDPERFLRHVGLYPTAASRRLTGATVELAGEGDLDLVTFSADVDMAGGTMAIDGAVAEPFGRADLSANIRASHPTPVRLVRALGLPGISAADTAQLGDGGALRMAAQARAAGDTISVDIVSLAVGGTNLAGQANLGLSGIRPVLDLVIIGDDISAFGLLAVLSSVQRVTDVVVDLETDRLMLGAMPMENASVRADISAAEATVGPVQGDMLGGSAEFSVSIRTEPGRDVVDGELEMQDVDPGRLLRAVGGPAALNGSLDIRSNFSAQGRSIGEYLTSLSGQAEIQGQVQIMPAENGAASYATGLFGDNLPPIQQVSELSSVLKTAFGDHEAPLDARVVIENGIARADTVSIAGMDARAVTYGSWDIAGERVEVTLEVSRQAAEKDPYFVLGLAGPPQAPNVKIAGSWLKRR